MMKTLVALLAGAAFAGVLIVACSDDSPTEADAAVCDCPSAEPPISGRIARIRSADGNLPANGIGGGIATCPAGATLLSGWCDFENMPGTPPQLALVKAGASTAEPNAWTCVWQNYNAGAATVHAEAVCLMPAQ
ncbi:MAG: hypothetical protein IPL61_37965 [Myxococcales bacterium]|nr:hypothetical protein [Myxococcales bacterium]